MTTDHVTSLFGGKRLPKSDIRIESYGTIDELNAHLGLLRDQLPGATHREWLKRIQDRLFDMGAVLATAPGKTVPTQGIETSDVEALERAIDILENELPELKHFVLPGGHPLVSQCHIARCVCRRAERRVVALSQSEPVPALILRFLNRLSDFLFVLSRTLAQDMGVEEIKWSPRK